MLNLSVAKLVCQVSIQDNWEYRKSTSPMAKLVVNYNIITIIMFFCSSTNRWTIFYWAIFQKGLTS